MKASESLVSKANLVSVKRSIEYRIIEEAKSTRAHNNVRDIDKIMKDGTI